MVAESIGTAPTLSSSGRGFLFPDHRMRFVMRILNGVVLSQVLSPAVAPHILGHLAQAMSLWRLAGPPEHLRLGSMEPYGI